MVEKMVDVAVEGDVVDDVRNQATRGRGCEGGWDGDDPLLQNRYR